MLRHYRHRFYPHTWKPDSRMIGAIKSDTIEGYRCTDCGGYEHFTENAIRGLNFMETIYEWPGGLCTPCWRTHAADYDD